MKPKLFSRRLQLKKETVATLEYHQMGKVKGGACTCIASGCRTYIWQECSPSDTYLVTICSPCETLTLGTCC